MQAFIFDFDGVVVDSEKHWAALDAGFFPSIAPGYTHDHAQRMMGMNLRAGYDFLVTELGLALPYEEYERRLRKNVYKVYSELASPLPGLLGLLDRLDAQGIPIAIASSSERDWIETCLTRLGLMNRFRSISTPADVGGKAKPHPDVYLKAAERCGAAPDACIAIEDSKNDIAAAKAAGMHCIGLRTEMSRYQNLDAADAIVESLDGVTDEMMHNLL